MRFKESGAFSFSLAVSGGVVLDYYVCICISMSRTISEAN